MTDEEMQHLNFIQTVITRMNTNSFQIKTIAVTIVSALLAVYASNDNVLFVLIGIIPVIFFWFLDAYYLQQERKFRGIYSDVAGLTSINTLQNYEMPIHKYNGGRFSYINSFISKTIIWVYLPIIFLLASLALIVLNNNVC